MASPHIVGDGLPLDEALISQSENASCAVSPWGSESVVVVLRCLDYPSPCGWVGVGLLVVASSSGTLAGCSSPHVKGISSCAFSPTVAGLSSVNGAGMVAGVST